MNAVYRSLSALFCAALLFLSFPALGQSAEENPDRPVPLEAPEESLSEEQRGGTASDFYKQARLGFRLTYYGRERNSRAPEGDKTRGEIHVNAVGPGLDFRSGYAWGIAGFDASLAANLGHGSGNSEVLQYDPRTNKDSGSAGFREAAVKLRAGDEDFKIDLRGGYTPIRTGSIGTSAGINPHGYRGFEAKASSGGLSLGYGWADQFHNDWDDRFRDMTNAWHQNRYGDSYGKARRINYIHSLGLVYNFGPEGKSFLDLGIGEGKDYRQNAQAAASHAFILDDSKSLTLTGYVHWGRYEQRLTGISDPAGEYHASASAAYKTGPWEFFLGAGFTEAPDSAEMQFRLTPWANSDNRNFIQTWGQLDDFVWDGTKVVKASVGLDLSEYVIPGLSVGAACIYGWDIRNAGRGRTSAQEFDAKIEYRVPEGPMRGFSFGVYPALLEYENNDFAKQSRRDVKFIAAYNYELDFAEFFK